MQTPSIRGRVIEKSTREAVIARVAIWGDEDPGDS